MKKILTVFTFFCFLLNIQSQCLFETGSCISLGKTYCDSDNLPSGCPTCPSESNPCDLLPYSSNICGNGILRIPVKVHFSSTVAQGVNLSDPRVYTLLAGINALFNSDSDASVPFEFFAITDNNRNWFEAESISDSPAVAVQSNGCDIDINDIINDELEAIVNANSSFINIFFVEVLNGYDCEGDCELFQDVSAFSGGPNGKYIIFNDEYITDNPSSTIIQVAAHELGHTLGLSHTFYSGPPFNNNMNSCFENDGIVDTSPLPQFSTDNLMDYHINYPNTSNVIPNDITVCQRAKMIDVLHECLYDLCSENAPAPQLITTYESNYSINPNCGTPLPELQAQTSSFENRITDCNNIKWRVESQLISGTSSSLDLSEHITSIGNFEICFFEVGIYNPTCNSIEECININVTDCNPVTCSTPPIIDLSNTTITNASCPNLDDGQIELIVVQGTPPFTYHWDDGFSTSNPVRNNLDPDTYGVTVTDSQLDENGEPCSDMASFTVGAASPCNSNTLASPQVFPAQSCYEYGNSIIVRANSSGGFPIQVQYCRVVSGTGGPLCTGNDICSTITTISANSNDGSVDINWNIPTVTIGDYYIALIDGNDADNCSLGDDTFTITNDCTPPDPCESITFPNLTTSIQDCQITVTIDGTGSLSQYNIFDNIGNSGQISSNENISFNYSAGSSQVFFSLVAPNNSACTENYPNSTSVNCITNACGNGVCDSSEDCASCPTDCGVCPTIINISPNSGCLSGNINIQYELSFGNHPVAIEYCTALGNCTLIANNVINGSFPWTIPSTLSGDYYFKVYGYPITNGNAPFTGTTNIVEFNCNTPPSIDDIVVSTPSDNCYEFGNDILPINFSTSGGFLVTVEVCRISGATESCVSAGLVQSDFNSTIGGNFNINWNIPNTIDGDGLYLIKIYNPAQTSIIGRSETFEINENCVHSSACDNDGVCEVNEGPDCPDCVTASTCNDPSACNFGASLPCDYTDCQDCAGVQNGTAYFDDCGSCVGGTTGLLPCNTSCPQPANVQFEFINNETEVRFAWDNSANDAHEICFSAGGIYECHVVPSVSDNITFDIYDCNIFYYQITRRCSEVVNQYTESDAVSGNFTRDSGNCCNGESIVPLYTVQCAPDQEGYSILMEIPNNGNYLIQGPAGDLENVSGLTWYPAHPNEGFFLDTSDPPPVFTIWGGGCADSWSLLLIDYVHCAFPCSNGIQDGNETGIDCGGFCDPCTSGTCTDGILNNSETDIDCGGPNCSACDPPGTDYCPPISEGQAPRFGVSCEVGRFTVNSWSDDLAEYTISYANGTFPLSSSGGGSFPLPDCFLPSSRVNYDYFFYVIITSVESNCSIVYDVQIDECENVEICEETYCDYVKDNISVEPSCLNSGGYEVIITTTIDENWGIFVNEMLEGNNISDPGTYSIGPYDEGQDLLITFTSTSFPNCPFNYDINDDGLNCSPICSSSSYTIPDNTTLSCTQDPLDLTVTGQASTTCTTCAVPTSTVIQNNTDNCNNTGTVLRQWTYTDECGNTIIETQTITIEDNQAPALIGPEDITVICGSSFTDLSITGNFQSATDNCSSDLTPTYTDVSDLTGCGGTGTITRTWSVTDDCDNTGTDVQIITVEAAAGTFTCPANVTVLCDASIDPADTGSPVADVCGGMNAASFVDSGALSAGGTITRTWSLTDACGTPYTCDQLISMDACIATIDDPCSCADATNYFLDGQYYFHEVVEITSQTAEQWDMTNVSSGEAYDDAGNVLTLPFTGTETPAGSGIYLFDFWHTSGVGFSADYTEATSMMVLSIGNTCTIPALDLVCPAANDLGTYNCNTLENIPACPIDEASAEAAPYGLMIGDMPCGDIVILCTDDEMTNNCVAGNQTITRTITVLDDLNANGIADDGELTEACTFTITIEADTEVPTIDTEAMDMTVECDGTGNTTELDAWLANNAGATASDNCGNATFTNDFTMLSDDCGATGSATVTFTATDDCGLTATTTATFTIEDTTDPTIDTEAMDMTVECDGAGNVTELNAWIANNGGAMASDDCGSVVFTNDFTMLSDDCGATGSATVTFTATDDCGMTATTTATFTIEDTTDPMIDTEAMDMTVECDGAGNVTELNAWLANNGGAMASDDCGSVVFTNDFTMLSDDCGATGSATVTFTVTDECGMTAMTTATFTIEDTNGPAITCPSEQMLTCNDDPLPFALTISDFQAIGGTVTDDCSMLSELTISFVNIPIDQTRLNFCADDPAERTLTRIYTITDICGNASTCEQNFIYEQVTTGPVITSVPPDQTIDCAINAFPQANLLEFTTECEVEAVVEVSEAISNGPAGCNGTTIQYTYTVTDVCGRSAEAVQTYTLANDPPEFICPADFCVIECPADNEAMQAQFDDYAAFATVTTSCSEASISIDNNFSPNGFISQNCTNPTVDIEGTTAYQIVTFTASDACGRNATCTALVIVVDNDGPAINGNVSFGIADCNEPDLQGGYTNWATNQLNNLSATDDCSDGAVNLTYEPLSPNIDCTNGIASTLVTFSATDGCGNSSTQTAFYRIIDNGTGGPVMATVSGNLATEENEMIALANVAIEGGSNNYMMTEDDGYYHFDLEMAQNYTVDPSRNDDPMNGVTTYDLILLGQHILEINLLDSPYKMIAADVNESGSITALDLILLRRLILQIDDHFPSGKSWTFVDAQYIFPQPTNPFASTFPTVYNINSLTNPEIVDFIGVKLGDLNATANTTSLQAGDTRSSDGQLEIRLDDQSLKAGQEYELDFKARDFKAVNGFQFTLDFNPDYLELEDYVSSDLKNMSTDNFGFTRTRNGKITVSWNANEPVNITDDATLFKLSFTAKKEVQLSKAISLNSSLTANEAYQEDLLKEVTLGFGNNVNQKKFALLQNQPNPFAQETVIGFQLPEATDATLTIYDLSGRVIWNKTTNYDAGVHQVIIEKDDLEGTGVYYYQLSTGKHTAIRKMIVLK